MSALPTLVPEDCRVGVDLVDTAAVASSVQRFGRRYLERLFTEHELDCCRVTGGFSIPSLAARFAAKEAAIKVLEPPDAQPSWRSIEVRRLASGACRLELSEEAARRAAQLGIDALAVSLTHEADLAAAVVVALVAPSGGPVDRKFRAAGEDEGWPSRPPGPHNRVAIRETKETVQP
jgi:holo-[acyl-carrier protein] synthase